MIEFDDLQKMNPSKAKGMGGADGSIHQLVTMIQGACGLDTDWAKAISYYALATHGLPNLKKFPILLLEGPPGTGKSTILGILGQITNGPSHIDGSVSRAELRDSLNDTHTALIEEADRVSEGLVRNRYSDQTSETVVKREAARGWNRESLDLFGATVLHRRVPFKDPAVQSRGITVHTRKADGRLKSDLDAFTPYQDYLASLATEIKWEQAVDLGGSRILDTWAPILLVAQHLADEPRLTWATNEIDRAEAGFDAGQEEEPAQLVFNTILALSLDDHGNQMLKPKERIAMKAIRHELGDNELRLTSIQIGDIVRNFGLEIKKVGGTQYVYIEGKEKLEAIHRELGLQDEWFDN